MRASIVRVSAAAVLLVLGCSGGNGDGADTATSSPADAFAGSWTFDFGAITFDGACVPGVYPTAIMFTGSTMTITKNDATDVTAAFTATGVACDVGFTVSGAMAAVKAGQTCTISDGAVSGAFEISNGSLYFNSMHLVLNMSGGFAPMGTTMTTCPVNVDSSAP